MRDTNFRQLTEWLGVGNGQQGEWQEIAERPLLILVGVTGVGKTTTVEALKTAAPPFTLLPNRRALTDELIIGQMQAAAGEPVRQETDRIKRFAYTAQYREQFAGGMAHALSQLMVHQTKVPTERLVFDGVRGVNEVSYAAELLPHAYFLVLEAPLVVRVKRLLGRGDMFDQVRGEQPNAELTKLLTKVGGEVTAAEKEGLQELWRLVKAGGITAEDLQAKLKIVLTERQNYNPDGARDALCRLAPERTIVADTVALSPAAIAERTAAKWA